MYGGINHSSHVQEAKTTLEEIVVPQSPSRHTGSHLLKLAPFPNSTKLLIPGPLRDIQDSNVAVTYNDILSGYWWIWDLGTVWLGFSGLGALVKLQTSEGLPRTEGSACKITHRSGELMVAVKQEPQCLSV
jgi:hypothetical protein